MKYEVNFGGLNFGQGITINEIYVGDDTNRINASNKPTFHSLEELATICYIYGITIVEVPTPVVRNLLIFNSSADLVDNVTGSKKFMNVTYNGATYDITPDGRPPLPSGTGVASINVTAAGSGYTSTPDVAPASGDATFQAKLKAVTAAVVAGGSGYAVNDQITLSNGVVLKVDTLSTDAVATASVVTGGSFDTVDTGTLTQTSTTGAGTGATFTLSYGVESIAVVDPGDYDTAPALTISGGGGSGATATATLATPASTDVVSNILVKENKPIADSTFMQFVLDGNVVYNGKKDGDIEDMSSLIDWLTGNYDAFGDYADVSSGNIKAISVTGSKPFDSANYVRFR